MSKDATLFVAMPLSELLELMEKSIKSGFDKFSNKPTPPPEDELLNVEQTCTFLRISKVTLHKWKKERLIQAYRFGRKIFFKKKELLGSLKVMPGKRHSS